MNECSNESKICLILADGRIFRSARYDDVTAVSDIYKGSAKRGDGTTWNEFYPTIDDAANDLGADRLFVLEEYGRVVGCVSVAPESELSDLDFWKYQRPDALEITRLGVSPDSRQRGIAKDMAKALICCLFENGCSAIHLLAAKQNIAAINMYKSLGFDFRGECRMFDIDFYACELINEKMKENNVE